MDRRERSFLSPRRRLQGVRLEFSWGAGVSGALACEIALETDTATQMWFGKAGFGVGALGL